MKWGEFKKQVSAQVPDDWEIDWIDVTSFDLDKEVTVGKDEKRKAFSV